MGSSRKKVVAGGGGGRKKAGVVWVVFLFRLLVGEIYANERYLNI